MSGKCAIPSCASFEDDESCSFFELAPEWAKCCNVLYDPTLKICQKHFNNSDFISDPNLPYAKILSTDAIPIHNLKGDPIDKNNEKLNQKILSAVEKSDKLNARFSELEKELNVLNKKSNDLNRKISRKNVIVKKIKLKYLNFKRRAVLKDKSNLLTRCFSNAQINYLLGKNKVVWSDEDMAKAFCFRNLSNKECYLYLKNTLNVPLPSLSSVQKWAASN